MKSRWRKRICWGLALMTYCLSLAATLEMLQRPDALAVLGALATKAFWADIGDGTALVLEGARPADLAGALLVPVGPAEKTLPGQPEIWAALSTSTGKAVLSRSGHGFDALQGVRSLDELSEGRLSDLYFGGIPERVVRRGDYLYLLTSNAVVQIIDCSDPLRPHLIGRVTEAPIMQMAEREGLLYLLVAATSTHPTNPRLVVFSLAASREPLELESHPLPAGSFDIFFDEDHLVVVSKQQRKVAKSPETALFLESFRPADGFELVPHGAVKVSYADDKLVAYGNFLITANIFKGAQLIDYRSPSPSGLTVSLPVPAKVKHMVLSGERLFALEDHCCLHVIDLSDPGNPRKIIESKGIKHALPVLFVDGASYYFARNGHLLVYENVPAVDGEPGRQPESLVSGTLLSDSGSSYFIPSGQTAQSITDLETPGLALKWRDRRLVLQDGDRLLSYLRSVDGTETLVGSLRLPEGQRWLTGTTQRIYVGGGKDVLVVDARGGGRLEISGRLELPVDATWHAVVSRQRLWVAAGRDGLLAFSLVEPDRPTRLELQVPELLKGLVDVRQLAQADDGRMFAAGGPAGLLCFKALDGGRIKLCERLDFNEPVVAVGVIDGLCLAATRSSVHVVDIEVPLSLQKLGRIAMRRIERFAMVSSQHWAAFERGRGWHVSPFPVRLSPEAVPEAAGVRLKLPAASPPGEYRVVLHNDAGIKALTETYQVRSPIEPGTSGVSHGVN